MWTYKKHSRHYVPFKDLQNALVRIMFFLKPFFLAKRE